MECRTLCDWRRGLRRSPKNFVASFVASFVACVMLKKLPIRLFVAQPRGGLVYNFIWNDGIMDWWNDGEYRLWETILGAQASCLCIQRTGKMPVPPVPNASQLLYFFFQYSTIPSFLSSYQSVCSRYPRAGGLSITNSVLCQCAASIERFGMKRKSNFCRMLHKMC